MMGGKTFRNCEPALGASGAVAESWPCASAAVPGAVGAGGVAGCEVTRAAGCDGSKDSFIASRGGHEQISENSAIGQHPTKRRQGNLPRLVAVCHAAIGSLASRVRRRCASVPHAKSRQLG